MVLGVFFDGESRGGVVICDMSVEPCQNCLLVLVMDINLWYCIFFECKPDVLYVKKCALSDGEVVFYVPCVLSMQNRNERCPFYFTMADRSYQM